MSYPWTIDSQNGTTPSTTGFLQIVSPNGLYLNSTSSAGNSNSVYMTGYITGSPGNPGDACGVYYYADRIYFFWNYSASQTVYQSSYNNTRPNIYTNNENIYIVSQQDNTNPLNGLGAIYLQAQSGLWLNGVQITPGGGGGGISSIQTQNNTMNIQNTSGPTTYVDINLTTGTPSNITITNQGNGTWQIDGTGGGGGGGLSWNDLAYPSNIYNGISAVVGNDVCFGMDASTTGYYDIATLCISNVYSSYIGSTSPSGRTGYLKVGYDDTNTTQNFTLVTNTNPGFYSNNPCTMATVSPSGYNQADMYLWADLKSTGGGIFNSKGNGDMYLGARQILPGNGTNVTSLGNNTYAWFDVVSYNFNNISDIKLKEDIIKLDSNYCINLLKNINPVIYKYKSDEKKKSHFGVIAQEIKEIIGDENLALHNDGEIQSISYNELIAPLIKTVQHLLQKVEDLEAAIKDLKK